jgi:hypothetical protein
VTVSEIATPEFSLVRGGPFYAWRHKLGLVPDKGLGLAKRVAVIVAVTWLPIVLVTMWQRHFFEGSAPDPLLRHFGVHARLLIAVPLLLFAEAPMERVVPLSIRQFWNAGLVAGSVRLQFIDALRKTEKLRDSIWGKLFLIAAILFAVSGASPLMSDEIAWALQREGQTDQIGFAGWWFLHVGRTVFVGLIAIWAWRLFVGWTLIHRISRLDLQLVPSHPDRAGGLGFVQEICAASAWIVWAFSVVLAGRWGHEVMYHGVRVDSLKPLVAMYAITMLLLFVAPLLMFARNLVRFKHHAVYQYSALVAGQGRLVHRKWIRGEEVGEAPILAAPELGCVGDTNVVYDAVERMRSIPLGKDALIPLVLAIGVPMLPVFAIELPIKDLLITIGESLV